MMISSPNFWPKKGIKHGKSFSLTAIYVRKAILERRRGRRKVGEIVKKKYWFSPKILVELSENLYTNYLHAFRELCANAYDADASRVDITILPHQIDFEDDGSGIEDVDKFLEKGSIHKQLMELTPKFKRKIIGTKGLGDLAKYKLCRRVDVLSNNGKLGMFLSFTDDSLDVDYMPYVNPTDALPHVGTKITLRNLKRSADPDEVRTYLAKTFQLLLSKEFRIFVNGQEVKPPAKLLPPNVEIDTTYGKIVGRLEKKGGLINIFLRGVFVKGEIIEANRLASGYVNVDFLIPTTDREDFVRDNEQWREFISKLRAHIIANYPPRRELVSKAFRKLLNKVAKNLTRAVARLKLPIEGQMPSSESGETGEIPEKTLRKKRKEKAEDKLKKLVHIEKEKKAKVRLTRFQAKVMKKVIGRSIKTGFGLKIRMAKAGEKERPVVPVPPNVAVVNIENPIIEILQEGKKYKLMEKELLLSRLIMEAYTDLVGKNPSKKEFLKMLDSLTLEYLRE